jgi:hypothetical protein
MNAPPMIYEWDGHAMVPLRRFDNLAAAHFTIGELYKLEQIEDRSRVSHNHFFAVLHEAWINLPEEMAERWPTEDHLRKWALIKTGYADQRQHVCSSHAQAVRTAAFIGPMDSFAIITVTNCVLTVWTAQSQSMKAMGKKEFQASKTAVLDYIAGLIDVEPGALVKEAGRAA